LRSRLELWVGDLLFWPPATRLSEYYLQRVDVMDPLVGPVVGDEFSGRQLDQASTGAAFGVRRIGVVL
jgi:hypothetical protein